MLKRKQQFAVLICGILLFAGAILPITAFAQNYEDSPFGLIGVNMRILSEAEDIVNLGAKTIRHESVGSLVWDRIEKERGIYDWGETDSTITRANDLGIKFLGNTISEARIEGIENFKDAKLPVRMDWYLEWLSATAERYDGDGIDDAPGSPKIDVIQINNEVDGKHFWDDTPENYAFLLKESYLTIKKTSPNIKVAIAGAATPTGYYSFYQDIFAELDRIKDNSNDQYFDVFDFHWSGQFPGNPNYIGIGVNEIHYLKNLISDIKNDLKSLGYDDIETYITEMSDYDGSPTKYRFHSEKYHASQIIKRYIYSISNGIDKVFWCEIIEHHNFGGEENGYFDYTGLIHNPKNPDSLSHKKLAYYTYKLMTEKLQGSDWDSITTVVDNIDNKYAYKFINVSTGNPTYVVWWDYFIDPTYTIGNSSLITLTGISSNQVIVTNTAPTDTTGATITDYNTAFQIDTLNVSGGSVSFYLKESPVFIEEISNTSIEETGGVTPNEFQLNQNYPNPFNPKTTISYQLPANADVTLKVYNMLGQEIRTLVNENKPTGHHSVVWNGTDNLGQQLSSGFYFYSLKSDNNYSITKKLLLIK